MPEDMYIAGLTHLARSYPKVTKGYDSEVDWVADRVQKIYENNEGEFNKTEAGQDYTAIYNIALGRPKDWKPGWF